MSAGADTDDGADDVDTTGLAEFLGDNAVDDGADDADTDDIRRLVEPQDHEFSANFNYSTGLTPWIRADRRVKENNGSVETTIETLGDTWDITLSYQESGIEPPRSGITPNGTKIQHETIREFRIHCEAQDEVGEKKANYHIRPRWQGMRVTSNDGDTHELSVPQNLVEDNDAVNVRVSGSNIDFDRYSELLVCAARCLNLGARYLHRQLHETSNIVDAAKYVRLNKDASGAIHSRTGPLASLAHVLQDDRSGFRKLVQNDSNERGERVQGYYHTATLGTQRVREVMPSHELPVECKHYYAREAHDKPDSHPLAHPKFEVAYQANRWRDTLYLDDTSLAQLETELTEWLYSVLHDAGLDLRAGGSTYVEDSYFSCENATTTASVVDLDLTEIRHEQESVVYRHLVDGMAPSDQECLEVLVSDGGAVSPRDIAEATGRHEDTVYDALGRLHDLVEHTYGEVSLKSTYLSELVADALDEAQRAVERATNTAVTAVNAADRGLDETTSAFLAWCEKYDVNRSLDGEMRHIELGRVESRKQAKRILREGYRLWRAMNREEWRFRDASYSYQVQEIPGAQLASVDDQHTVWQSCGGLHVWYLLDGR